MEKTAESKRKDSLRHKGEFFVSQPQTWNRRVTASGVTFGGTYVKYRKQNRKRQPERPETDLHNGEGSNDRQYP